MRLLHVVPTYLPAVAYGGPIFSVHALCRALAQRNNEVDVFTTNLSRSGTSDVPLDEPVLLDGVRVRYFASPALRRLSWSPTLGRALRREAASYDAIHAHTVFLWPTFAAARAAAGAKRPYFLSPRGMLVRELIERRNWLIKSAWIALIERRNIETASALHFTSEIEREEIGRFGWKLPRGEVIANGADEPQPADAAQCSTDVKEIAAVSPLVLFLGRISWKKGLDRLLRAFTRTPQGMLAIVGPDVENLVPQLSELAAKLDLAHRVRFLPRMVLGADKEYLFERAQICVLPSHSENFGNTVLESMRRGVPVVVTPQVGAADIVRDAGGGIVTDAPTFGEAMARLIDAPSLARAMGEAGRRYVIEHCSWSSVAARMETLYRAAMDR